MTAGEVASHVGLWWPAADEDGLRRAADAWRRLADELNRAADVVHAGAARAATSWTGTAADRFADASRTHQQTLRDDAVACQSLASGLQSYADAVADAKRRVEELAVTAGATIVAGVGLAWLTFGTSAAVAGEVTAGLVAAASAVGVELSATVAAVTATGLVGATFGAGEAAVVDMAVTQPLRVEVFHDGGYSAPEAGHAMVDGGLFGGALGGASGPGAVAPMARIAAGELTGVRAPGGAIRAALDPGNWGRQGALFRPGVVRPVDIKVAPHEISTAEYLSAKDGTSVHLRSRITTEGTKNPDALVRRDGKDPGIYTEFKRARGANSRSVMRGLRESQQQLEAWGGGEAVIDGRGVDLTADVAEEGITRAQGAARSGGEPIPGRITVILGDGRTVRFMKGTFRVD